MEVGIIVLVAAIIVAGFVLSAWWDKRRREALALVAKENGWLFHPTIPPGGDEWPRRPLLGGLAEARFSLFSVGHCRQSSNFFFIEIPEGCCHIFDYNYTTGSGKSSNTHYYTVFMLFRSFWNLPAFNLEPQNLFHGIGKLFGMQDIDLGEHPAFSKRYLLRGRDENAVRHVFENRYLVQMFEAMDPFCMQASGDAVVLWRANSSQIHPRELRNGAEIARSIAERLS